MNDVALIIADLVRAGVDAELVGRVAAAISGTNAPKARSAAAVRQERYRQRIASRNVTNDVTVTHNCDVTEPSPPPPKKVSPTPPSKNNPPNPILSGSNEPSTRDAGEFERWYEHFPNKVGKEAARKAWPRARQKASYEMLCGGLRRYISKTDDRPWCNPATWLNQGRWLDRPSTAPPKPLAGGELFLAAAERMRNEREQSERANDAGDWGNADGFPVLIEHKT